jgi:signal transduction histidine kinase
MNASKDRRFFQFRSLSARVTLWVLIFLMVFTVAMALVAYELTRNWLEDTAIANLEALASARQLAVESYVGTHIDKLKAFEQPDLEIKISALLEANGREREILNESLFFELQRKQHADPDIVWVDILDLEGYVYLSTFPERHGIYYGEEEFFSQGIVHPYISNPFYEEGEFFIKLAIPLHDAANRSISVLVLRFDARKLLAIVGNYTGLGNTGETVLGTRIGNQIHFLAPLRFDPNLSEIQPAPADGERAKPMIHATSGQSGVTRAPDYRDVRVVAAYRPIDTTPWGLVVKQDESEAFESVAQMQSSLLFGLGVLMLVGLVVISPLVRTAIRPLRDLEEATRRVADGNLTTEVLVNYQDEVGQLGQSFNLMVKQLRTLHTELERSNDELSSFAYVVSHDLKAPLRAISQLSTWIVKDYQDHLDEEGKEKLRLLIGRTQRMHELIEGVLEYSRVGRVQERTQEVDLNMILPEIVDSLLNKDNITISIQEDFPVVAGEPVRLRQVFQNLIENAIKYHNKTNGWIRVEYEDWKTHWQFCIADNGPGIEKKYQEKIFQLFQTLTPRDQVESTGVGLAVVKKFIEINDGMIWIESESEQGSRFFFTWPKQM